MPFDQNKLRTILARVASEEVRRFAERHQSEQFYGFAFDCNADHFEILLALNTEQALQDMAKKLQTAPLKSFLPKFDKMMEEKYGVKPKRLFHDKSVPEIVELLRWECGDWKYRAVYNCNDDPEWAALAAFLSEEEDGDLNREMFLNAVCHVLQDIQPALDCLKRTGDFRAFVIDHDESFESAWARLERVQTHDGA
jgi:hypothetical protein